MDVIDFNREARMLRALAHPVRLQIVHCLMQNGRTNVKTLWTCLDLPQSQVSQHLILLRNHGILGSERCGTGMYYFIENPCVGNIIRCVKEGKDHSSSGPGSEFEENPGEDASMSGTGVVAAE